MSQARPPTGPIATIRRALGALIAVAAHVLVALAVLVGLAKLALPWYAADARRVAALLEAELGQPVRLACSAADWRGMGPVLELQGIEIGLAAPLRAERARLGLDPWKLLAGRPGALDLRLAGLTLELAWRDDALVLGGLPLPDAGAAGAGRLRLAVADGRLRVTGIPKLGAVELEGLELEIESSTRGRQLRGQARLPHGGGEIRLVLERDDRRSRAWLRLRSEALAAAVRGMAPLGVMLVGGRGTLELWFERDQAGWSLAAELGLQEPGFAGRHTLPLGQAAVEPRHRLARLAGWLRARGVGGRWRAELGDLDLGEGGSGRLWLAGDGKGSVVLRGEALPLAPFAALLALSALPPERLRAWLYAAAPQGRVRELELRLAAGRLEVLQGVAEEFRVAPALGLPGGGPWRVEWRGDAEGLLAELAGTAAELDWPRVFPRPLPVAGGPASLALGPSGVEFSARALVVAGLPLALRLELDASGGLAAAAQSGAIAIPELVPHLPYGILPPRTAAWLRRALAAGLIREARAVFAGRPAAWPFAAGEGGLRVVAAGERAELAFHPRWPHARIGAARLEFRDRSLRVEAKDGAILGIRVPFAEAEVPNLDRAELALRASGLGAGEALLDFLAATPLVHRLGPWLMGMRLDGQAEGELELLLRVHDPAAPDELRGRVRLADASFSDAKSGLALEALGGALAFDGRGLRSEALSARYLGDPVSLALAVGEACADPGHVLELGLAGRLPVASLLRLLRVERPLPVHAAGTADWSLALAVPRGPASTARLALRSDLVGIGLLGPAPFVKPGEQPWPLAVDLTQSGEGRWEGALRLVPGLAAAMRAEPGRSALALRFGDRGELPEPPASGLRIEGRTGELALDGWLAASMVGAGPITVELEVDRLLLAGAALGRSRLRVAEEEQELRFALEGEAVAGTGRFAARPSPRLILDLERLHWPAGAGEGGGTPTSDPSRLPEIHARVGDLRLGEARLGAVRVEARPEGDGLRIGLLEARAEGLSLHGHGRWRGQGSASRSELALTLVAPRLGDALARLGYASGMADGPLLAEAELVWSGSPLAAALERVSGRLRVRAGPGRLLELEPGAGRILGLVSLDVLPRRLLLDFRDVLAPGMSFTAMRGSFDFANGAARTEDFELLAPGMRILVRGSTDLRARRYDQRVDVVPEVGGALPFLGALAGGAPGAAVGMLARNVLASPLGTIGRAEYRLSGPWERPVLERLVRAPRVSGGGMR